MISVSLFPVARPQISAAAALRAGKWLIHRTFLFAVGSVFHPTISRAVSPRRRCARPGGRRREPGFDHADRSLDLAGDAGPLQSKAVRNLGFQGAQCAAATRCVSRESRIFLAEGARPPACARADRGPFSGAVPVSPAAGGSRARRSAESVDLHPHIGNIATHPQREGGYY